MSRILKGNNAKDFVFDNMDFQCAVTVEGDLAVLWDHADRDLGSPP